MSRISTIRHYHGQPVLLTMVYSVIRIGRNRINEGMASRSGLYEWCSGLWTFLFGIFYLQYKINHLARFIEGHKTDLPMEYEQ